MPYARRSTTTRRVFPRRRRAPPRRRVGKKATLKATVNQIISRSTEVKHATQTGAANFNNMISSSGDVLNLLPDVQPGIGPAQRVGVKIKPRGLYVKGYMQLFHSSNDLPRTRVGVRVLVGMPKNIKETQLAKNLFQDWGDELMDFGHSTGRFSGDVRSFLAKVNSRRFTTYYDKRMYLTQPYSFTYQNDPLDPVTDLSATADLHYSTKFFNFKIPFKGTWEYAAENNGPVSIEPQTAAGTPIDASAPDYGVQFPLSNGCVMLVGYCFLDGAAPSEAATGLRGAWHSDLYYTDS